MIYATSYLTPTFPLPRCPLEVLEGIVLLGIIVIVAGVFQFKQSRTTLDPRQPNKTSKLVTGGIYKLTRNPMYLGMALIVLAASLHFISIYSFLCWFAFLAYITRFQIVPEEHVIMQIFGQEYQDYQAQVRRWI